MDAVTRQQDGGTLHCSNASPDNLHRYFFGDMLVSYGLHFPAFPFGRALTSLQYIFGGREMIAITYFRTNCEQSKAFSR